MSQPIGSMMQMAYVVENLEQTIEEWGKIMQVGPFVIMESFEIDNMQYRGRSCESLDIRLALGYSGGMCIEFIEQKCDTPSVYRDVVESSGYGFHHWAFITENFEADVKRYQDKGHEVCFSGKVSVGERYVYLDAGPQVHSMIEVIEYSPEVGLLFANIEELSKNWDGKEPIVYAP